MGIFKDGIKSKGKTSVPLESNQSIQSWLELKEFFHLFKYQYGYLVSLTKMENFELNAAVAATSDAISTLSAQHKAVIKVVEKTFETASQSPSNMLSLDLHNKQLGSVEAVLALIQVANLLGQPGGLRFPLVHINLSLCKFMPLDRISDISIAPSSLLMATAKSATLGRSAGKTISKIAATINDKSSEILEKQLLLELCQLLQRSTTLRHLNLSHNSLGTQFVVQLLLQGVRVSESLETLGLRNVAVDGAKTLVPDTLCAILLSDADYKAVFGRVKESASYPRPTNLRSLDLSKNTWSEDAIQKLLRTVYHCPQLIDVKISDMEQRMTGQLNCMTLDETLTRNHLISSMMEEIVSGVFRRQFKTKLNTFRDGVRTFKLKNTVDETSFEGDHVPVYKMIAQGDKAQRLNPFKPMMKSSKRFPSGYAMSTGRRSEMQDMVCMAGNFIASQDGSTVSDDFWAVFDGHGGREAANYAAGNLVNLVIHELETLNSSNSTNDRVVAIQRAFKVCDKRMASWCTIVGTTAVAMYTHGDDRYIVNLGDSRAILYNSKSEAATCLTRDHRPADPVERQRILDLPGGFIEEGRVNGKLSVTRSLGDSSLAPFISCIPDVEVSKINPDDQFIVLASDGLWDIFTGAEESDVVDRHSILHTGNLTKWHKGMKEVTGIILQCHSPSEAAKRLCKLAYNRGSDDNISVVVVFLNFNGSKSPPLPDKDEEGSPVESANLHAGTGSAKDVTDSESTKAKSTAAKGSIKDLKDVESAKAKSAAANTSAQSLPEKPAPSARRYADSKVEEIPNPLFRAHSMIKVAVPVDSPESIMSSPGVRQPKTIDLYQSVGASSGCLPHGSVLNTNPLPQQTRTLGALEMSNGSSSYSLTKPESDMPLSADKGPSAEPSEQLLSSQDKLPTAAASPWTTNQLKKFSSLRKEYPIFSLNEPAPSVADQFVDEMINWMNNQKAKPSTVDTGNMKQLG